MYYIRNVCEETFNKSNLFIKINWKVLNVSYDSTIEMFEDEIGWDDFYKKACENHSERKIIGFEILNKEEVQLW